MERTNGVPTKKALTAVLLVLVSTVGWIGETCAHNGKRLDSPPCRRRTRFIPVNELKPRAAAWNPHRLVTPRSLDDWKLSAPATPNCGAPANRFQGSGEG